MMLIDTDSNEMTAEKQTSGFPPGYFVIRSVGADRLLDVTMDSIEDGTPICLWPEKESSLVESFRNPDANNQVFFIDTTGALCSRSSGHALDIQGDRVVQRHRRPISHPYPNAYAHPLPKFNYNPHTGEITVQFSCDPSYPSPTQAGRTSSAWMSRTYLLTSIPLRRPRTIVDDASDFISSNILSPTIGSFSFLTGGRPRSPVQAAPDEVFGGNIDLKDDEVVDEERGDEGEVDDSPEAKREVRMIVADPSYLEGRGGGLLMNEKARNRRRWRIIPLRTANAKTAS